MKKVILSSLAFVITLSQIGTINANALEMVDEIKENVNIENIEIENDKVFFTAGDEECIYDLEEDSLTIDDTTIYFETKIDYIDPSLNMSEEEMLELEKEMMKQKFIDLANEASGIALYSSSYDPQVPANAPFVKCGGFTKNIAEIKSKFETAIARFSIATGVLTKLKAISKDGLMNSLAKKFSKTVTAMTAFNVQLSGKWKYNLERTTKTYPAGITNQICYRYAHSGVSGNISCSLGSKKFDFTNNTKGAWWVSGKPY